VKKSARFFRKTVKDGLEYHK